MKFVKIKRKVFAPNMSHRGKWITLTDSIVIPKNEFESCETLKKNCDVIEETDDGAVEIDPKKLGKILGRANSGKDKPAEKAPAKDVEAPRPISSDVPVAPEGIAPPKPFEVNQKTG